MRNLTDRLSHLVDELCGGKHTVFARQAGVPISTFQGYIQGRSPHVDHLLRICETFNVSADWILRGFGSPYIKDCFCQIDADPETNSLLAMTRTILGSETGFSGSLRANIRSFFEAVQTQKRIENLEQRLSELERDRGGGENGGGSSHAQAILAPKITKKGRSVAT